MKYEMKCYHFGLIEVFSLFLSVEPGQSYNKVNGWEVLGGTQTREEHYARDLTVL